MREDDTARGFIDPDVMRELKGYNLALTLTDDDLDVPDLLRLIAHPSDDPFGGYTPCPGLDRWERKIAHFGREAASRTKAAWRVLRYGDDDPFDVGCGCC